MVSSVNLLRIRILDDLLPGEVMFHECNHNEADTCLVLYLQDAALDPFKYMCLRSTDREVVFLMTLYTNTINVSQLIVDATVGNNQGKYIKRH
jgi:hypothetical protein